ncbi:BaiN/RdsA family NAD(P)/FAD-dependent oxidoreductase [Phenylobacterium koreense]|uniref:Flavoprotein (TIGR03862 family) n=1 Tax=Phenylobacterium koreense TaxID=266125 RepID=A0ABV2EML4_9CAUL
MSHSPLKVAVIGGGPAGLMATELLSAGGVQVDLYDRMPSLGRKFLMAGRGGLNLTHSEDFKAFVARYGEAAAWMRPVLEAFTPADLTAWAEGLGQPTFIGSSGRVFPRTLKASPLLRAWIGRLHAQGVRFHMHSEWRGWNPDGELVFNDGESVPVDVVVLALGGASWPRLGSTGGWADILQGRGVAVTPFEPANSGFDVAWSPIFADRFAGQPLKNIALSLGDRTVRGEAMIATYGLEGGAVYALSTELRQAIRADGSATIQADLRPDMTRSRLADRLHKAPAGQSAANLLRKAVNLSPVEINLLREGHGVELPRDAGALARAIKATPLRLTGVRGLDRAISSAGGVALPELDEGLMIRRLPGVYAVGEMLDWEAPTGGYLLQACFATGVAAARAILRRQAS